MVVVSGLFDSRQGSANSGLASLLETMSIYIALLGDRGRALTADTQGRRQRFRTTLPVPGSSLNVKAGRPASLGNTVP